jgi:hypothetical protein
MIAREEVKHPPFEDEVRRCVEIGLGHSIEPKPLN